MSLLGSAAHVLRREGLNSFLTKTIKKIVRPAIEVNRFHFFEADLTDSPRVPETRVALELRTGRLEDLETFQKVFVAGGKYPAVLRRNLARGERLILGLCNGKLVHYSWTAFSTAWIDEIGITLMLGPHESYGYDAYTVPEWRGRGIQPAASAFKTRLERANGATRHISYARADNRPALRTMAKLGRRKTKTVWRVSCLGMGRPFIFGVGGDGSPVFVVRPRKGAHAPAHPRDRRV